MMNGVLKMQAVVLAAGMSTRLRNITGEIPKPIVKIGGVSMLERCIKNLEMQGFKEIIITTHYKEELIRECLKNKFQNLNLSFSYEDKLLDTAGSLKKMENVLNDNFFVCGGSFLLLDQNLDDIIKYHLNNNYIATVAFWNCNEAELLPYFGQAIISNGTVVKFKEKPLEVISPFVHSTYQVFNRRIFQFYEGKKSIPELLNELVEGGYKIGAYISNGVLINISNDILYRRAVRIIEGKF